MSYSLIIVDDEDTTREGLARYVDWASVGFQVAAVFPDGNEAIEYLNKTHVDVVLSDIKMTSVSGLDIAKFICENKPQTSVVLISGYKEFDFARQALNYNVLHYLLKPTRLEEIRRVFISIKEKLDLEKESSERLLKERKHYEEIIPYLREELFTDLLIGVLKDKNEIQKRLKLARIDIDPNMSRICTVDVQFPDYDSILEDGWEYGKEGLNSAIRNFINVEDGGVMYFSANSIHNKFNVVALSLREIDDTMFKNNMERHFFSMKSSVKSVFGMDISIRIGSIFKNIFSIAVKNDETIQVLDCRNCLPNINAQVNLVESQKMLLSYISAANFEAVYNLMDNYIDSIKNLEIKNVHNLVIDLFSLISNKLADIGSSSKEMLRLPFSYSSILQLDDIGKVKTWCKAVLTDILKTVEIFKGASEKHVIYKSKEYINNNFSKDMSLEDVANYVFLSPVYFSRLFKQQTGENFIDYLIKVRMEEAKGLLRQVQYKSYEISLIVGYKTSKHFSKLFKQYTGYTPTEYRNNIFGESEANSET